MLIRGLRFTKKFKGGPGDPGSGHHGHAGRPSQVGGSLPSSAAGMAIAGGINAMGTWDEDYSRASDVAESMHIWIRDMGPRSDKITKENLRIALVDVPEHWKEPGAPLMHGVFGTPVTYHDMELLHGSDYMWNMVELLANRKPMPWWEK